LISPSKPADIKGRELRLRKLVIQPVRNLALAQSRRSAGDRRRRSRGTARRVIFAAASSAAQFWDMLFDRLGWPACVYGIAACPGGYSRDEPQDGRAIGSGITS
jgi:hypothetical protein